MTTPVYLELGQKKVFASALAWPGWCRSARSEEAALDALAAYVPRYAVIAARAGLPFPTGASPRFDVIERLAGGGGTDFGVPDRIAAADGEEVTPAIATRQASLVRAAWEIFDEVAAATPEELRKGPRGGGRDRDKIIDHVLGSETGYARQLGIKRPQAQLGDWPAIEALREEILTVLGTPNDGTPPSGNGWPTRYAARRIAWHVLDHTWEMQDRTTP
jgi:hypothetical protein